MFLKIVDLHRFQPLFRSIIETLLLFYICIVLSGSFAIGLQNTFYFLVGVACCIYLIAFRVNVPAPHNENKLIYLFIYLWVVTAFQENKYSGLNFLLREYNELAFICLITWVTSSWINTKKLVTVCCFSISIFFISFLLLLMLSGFSQEYELIFFGKNDPATILGGKFVQALLGVLTCTIFLCFLILYKAPLYAKLACVFLVLVLFFGLSLYTQSRSAIVMVLASSFLVACFQFKRWGYLQSFFILVFLISLPVLTYYLGFLDSAYLEAEGFLSGADWAQNKSIAQRLQTVSALSDFEPANWFFGFGAGGWFEWMSLLNMNGKISDWHYKWRDFHSEYVWMLVLGGLPAVIFYVRILGSFVRGLRFGSTKCDTLPCLLYVSIGAFLFLSFFVFGLFNSIFTAIKEGHILTVCCIIFFILAKDFARAN